MHYLATIKAMNQPKQPAPVTSTRLIYADRVILAHLLDDVKQAEERVKEANTALADRLKLHMDTSTTLDNLYR